MAFMSDVYFLTHDLPELLQRLNVNIANTGRWALVPVKESKRDSAFIYYDRAFSVPSNLLLNISRLAKALMRYKCAIAAT
jgi:hypothetical protein